MHGFYPVCNSSGVIVVYVDFPSRQNTKRASFLGLAPSISHRRLCNPLFVLFNLLSFVTF